MTLGEAPSVDATLREVHERFGTPAYVFFLAEIERRIGELKAAFGGRFAISYAVKSNPNPRLLAWLAPRIEYLDVSSLGELQLAQSAGWAPERVSFTGPGKREFELREAIAAGIGELVIESPREAALADEIAGGFGRVQDVLIRLAPDRVPKGFGDQMAGRPVAFGIDVEDIDEELPKILSLSNLRVVGLHVYSGTQCLKAAAICDNYDIFIEVFGGVCARHGLSPQKTVFGSGLGVPYHGEPPLDLGAVAERTNPALDLMQQQPCFTNTQRILELGRYLVGEAGVFLTQVVSLKQSRGTRIAICDGGMNNHLPASGNFGMVVHRAYAMHRVGGGLDHEKVDLVGPLCTSIDRLARGVELPKLHEGDLIALHNSGAYGLTASPIHFISHPAPREILVDGDELVDVSRAF